MYGEGADSDAGNVRNETPLMFAAGNGHLEIVSWLTDTEGANYTAASIPGNYKSHLIVHGDTSGCDEPPVDFKTKVPLWPGQTRTGQAKTELQF